jgi:hypothetical protein
MSTLLELKLREAMMKKAAPKKEKHEDVKQDKKMVKKMVKKGCLK